MGIKPSCVELAQCFGVPNQPGQPGPVVGIYVDKGLRNELNGLVVATPRVIERFTLDGKMCQHVGLPEPLTCFTNGKIGGMGRVLLCATQGGKVFILKANSFENMLELNSRSASVGVCTNRQLTRSPSLSPTSTAPPIIPSGPGTVDMTPSGNLTFTREQTKTSLVDEKRCYGVEVCSLAVKETFAELIKYVMAGNVSGQIFMWEVPSTKLLKIIDYVAEYMSQQATRAAQVGQARWKEDTGSRNAFTADQEEEEDESDHTNDDSLRCSLLSESLLSGEMEQIGELCLHPSAAHQEQLSDESDTSSDDQRAKKDDGEITPVEFRDQPLHSMAPPGDDVGGGLEDIDLGKSPLMHSHPRENPGPNTEDATSTDQDKTTSRCHVGAMKYVGGDKNMLWVGYGNGCLVVFDLWDLSVKMITSLAGLAVSQILYSSYLDVMITLSGNQAVGLWDAGTLTRLRNIPAPMLTCGVPLSYVYLLEAPPNWDTTQTVLLSACMDGSIFARRIERRPADGELRCLLIRNYIREIEPRVPISCIAVDPFLNAAFIGDASGVVFTLPFVFQLLEPSLKPELIDDVTPHISRAAVLAETSASSGTVSQFNNSPNSRNLLPPPTSQIVRLNGGEMLSNGGIGGAVSNGRGRRSDNDGGVSPSPPPPNLLSRTTTATAGTGGIISSDVSTNGDRTEAEELEEKDEEDDTEQRDDTESEAQAGCHHRSESENDQNSDSHAASEESSPGVETVRKNISDDDAAEDVSVDSSKVVNYNGRRSDGPT